MSGWLRGYRTVLSFAIHPHRPGASWRRTMPPHKGAWCTRLTCIGSYRTECDMHCTSRYLWCKLASGAPITITRHVTCIYGMIMWHECFIWHDHTSSGTTTRHVLHIIWHLRMAYGYTCSCHTLNSCAAWNICAAHHINSLSTIEILGCHRPRAPSGFGVNIIESIHSNDLFTEFRSMPASS